MTFELENSRTELQDANRRILELERENAALRAIKPFQVRELSVLAYANGFTMWHYKAPVLSDIMSANYFADASDMMAKGDAILCSANDGVKTFYVVSNEAEVVIAPTT